MTGVALRGWSMHSRHDVHYQLQRMCFLPCTIAQTTQSLLAGILLTVHAEYACIQHSGPNAQLSISDPVVFLCVPAIAGSEKQWRASCGVPACWAYVVARLPSTPGKLAGGARASQQAQAMPCSSLHTHSTTAPRTGNAQQDTFDAPSCSDCIVTVCLAVQVQHSSSSLSPCCLQAGKCCQLCCQGWH